MNPVHSTVRAGSRQLQVSILLFLLTLATTTAAGARLNVVFREDRPFLLDDLLSLFTVAPVADTVAGGLAFSVTLLGILMAHELGHYFTCRYYGIDASPPYFLPAPTLIGTLGAFIRIRSPITRRSHLFDVGIAGPLAGFVFIVPALAIGLAYSKVIPGIGRESELLFSSPLLERMLAAIIWPGVAVSDIHLHPIARAAWAGLLATALNLLPIGQLDGGHILYSFVGARHKLLTNLFILALIPLAIFYSWSWAIWAVLLFLLGRKHPQIYDQAPVSRSRKILGIIALIVFVLCFSPAPVSPEEGNPTLW